MSRPGATTLALAIAASILAVSTAAVLIRLSDASPLAISFHRLLYATLLLAPFAWWKARDDLRGLAARDWLVLAGVGVVLAVHFAAWVTSLDLTTVAASVFLVTLHPVLVALVSQRLYGEGLTPLGYAAVAVALVGGLVITVGHAGLSLDALRDAPAPLVGDLLALVGAGAAAAYFLAGRGYRRRLGLLAYVLPVYASCTVVLGVMLVTMPAPYGGPLLGYPMREHALFLLLALLPMILGHTVLNWALGYVSAPVIATTILGEPIGASLLAFLVLGEVPGAWTLAGGALVLAGIGTVAVTSGAGAAPREGPPAA